MAVMDDLLNAFMGVDGKYARARRVDQADGAHISYALEARADPSLQELATRMLPIWCASCTLTSCRHQPQRPPEDGAVAASLRCS